MTIGAMANYSNAYRYLYVNRSQATQSLNKLSSGYRINSAADNAAGLAVSEKMRGQIGGLSKASQNAQNAVSLVQTAEGGLDSSSSILTRMKELAVQSANGTYTDADRAQINKEMTSLKSELDHISGSINYNGIKLLDGSLGGNASDGITFQVGANGSADQRIGVSIGNMSASALGLGDLDISTVEGANKALEAIDSAVDSVSGQRSVLGATQNRLEHTINNLDVSTENLTKSESRIRDVDMALEIMNYTQRNLMTQASQAMLAQGMNLSRQNMLSMLL